jgi:hypothetical protein
MRQPLTYHGVLRTMLVLELHTHERLSVRGYPDA